MKRISKFIILIVMLLCLVSCDISSYKARQNVESEFPDCIVYNVPNLGYRFIVVDSVGRIYYVQCTSLSSNDITYKTLIHNVQ